MKTGDGEARGRPAVDAFSAEREQSRRVRATLVALLGDGRKDDDGGGTGGGDLAFIFARFYGSLGFAASRPA